MSKHTILIGGDDGKVYRITSDDLKGHEVGAAELPHVEKLKKSFAGGLSHGVAHSGRVAPAEEPPNCTIAAAAGEYVHFLNLSASSDPDQS